MSLRNLIIPIGQQISFFSRKALDSVGFLNEDLHAIMDMDLYYRILSQKNCKFTRFKGLVGANRNHPKAKTFAQKELWNEKPGYIRARGGSSLTHRIDFWKMYLVRFFDLSLMRTFLLTRKHSGELLNGIGNSLTRGTLKDKFPDEDNCLKN